MKDKEKIKKEIERRIDLYSITEKDDLTFARMGELSSLIDFIDSIPEEHNEDLEKEIDKIWKTCNPIDEGMGVETANIHIEQFGDIASHFAEWQKQRDDKHIGDLQWEAHLKGEQETKQQMIEKAVEWIKSQMIPYGTSPLAIFNYIEEFKQAMKD